MCETCGCGETDEFVVRIPGEELTEEHDCNCGDDGEHGHHHDHEHHHSHEHGHHHHDHEDDGGHHHGKDHHHKHSHKHGDDGHSHKHSGDVPRMIDINKDILSENNLVAERNRGFFEGSGIFCLNLVSAPGSGKTTLLEKTIVEHGRDNKVFVIEGDQQSMNDAERIKKTGVPVVQINTGSGCHLDAKMVQSALRRLDMHGNSVLFVENVGNLVCPALFDLGGDQKGGGDECYGGE